MLKEKMVNRLMLEELRLEFEREMDLKKTLEGKATSMITIAGIIVTLLFGFTTFSSSSLHNIITQSLGIPLHFILIGVIGCIFSIGFSLWSIKLSNYAIVSTLEYFFDKEGKRNEEEIAKYIDAEENQIIGGIISAYLNTNNIVSTENSKKAIKVKWAHRFLVSSIVSIAISIIIAIFQLFYIHVPTVYTLIMSL
jgi:hypothetical protein